MSEKRKRFNPSKYGEKTTVMRIPDSMVETVKEMLKEREVLETQWQKAVSTPTISAITQYLTKLSMAGQEGLVRAMEESNVPSLIREAKQMRIILESDTSRLESLTLRGLLEVLSSEGIVPLSLGHDISRV